jgi:acetoin:2,6-dichlorophenolindophenol oxidoreductase subunit beta
MDAAVLLEKDGVSAEVIDLRVLNPLKPEIVIASAAKTGTLLVADGDWKTCGMAAEIIALVAESPDGAAKKLRFGRVTHPDSPAPTSSVLEQEFYFTAQTVFEAARGLLA